MGAPPDHQTWNPVRRFRQSLSEQLFRRVFFISVLLLGAYIIANAFDGFK